MNERDFFYWLRGFLELSEDKTLSEKQVLIIKDHMNLVAKKVTPNRASFKESLDLINVEKIKEEQPGIYNLDTIVSC